MSEQLENTQGCSHDCSTCGADCASRKPESLLEPQNPMSDIKKVIAVMSESNLVAP